MVRSLRGRRGRIRGSRNGSRVGDDKNVLTDDRVSELIRRTVTEILANQQDRQTGERPATEAGGRNNTHYAPRPTRQNGANLMRSTNPDYAKLVRESGRYIRIAHAANNWRSLPASIDRDITRLTENIKPPSPTEELKRQLIQAADNFRSAITAVVQDHLEQSAATVKGAIRELNHRDINMVHNTIRQQMQRPSNKKIQKTTVDRALSELAAITVEDDRPIMEDSECELDDLVDAIRRTDDEPEPAPTPGKRRLQPSPSSMPPNKSATKSTSHVTLPQTKNPRNKLILPPETKDWWALPASLPSTTSTLVVADSNGANWKTPEDVFVVALRGGRMRDVSRLLNAFRPPPSVKHITVAVGTNNRRDTSHAINSELTELQTAMNNTSRCCSFMEVPTHPHASPQEKDGTDYINTSARDLFADAFLDLDDIQIEPTANGDRAHYNEKTANQVVSRLINFIPTLHLNV